MPPDSSVLGFVYLLYFLILVKVVALVGGSKAQLIQTLHVHGSALKPLLNYTRQN